jgi:hypothetical protein
VNRFLAEGTSELHAQRTRDELVAQRASTTFNKELQTRRLFKMKRSAANDLNLENLTNMDHAENA